MPVITFNKKYLFSLLPKGTTEEKLNGQTYKMGFEPEQTGEKEVSLEITPNRPDLYSAVGFARAFKNFNHKNKKLKYELGNEEPELEISVGREAANVRPFIASIAVHGIHLDEEILADLINFSEKFSETYGRYRKKIAIGMHDLDLIHGQLHYNAYEDERYMPLNYRGEKLFSEVLKETEKGQKYGSIISASGRYPALKDSEGAISLIPILNSERTKVTTKTRNMLVDITGIYREPVEKTADLIASIFMDLGAIIKPVRINYPGNERITPSLEKRYISMALTLAESEIGVPIGSSNIISLANKAGYEAALVGDKVRFRIPEYRLDIINEQDIVEDIAIAYGYDYINPTPILASQTGALLPEEEYFDTISGALTGMGFTEEVNTYLSNESSNFTAMRIKETQGFSPKEKMEYVKLKNSKAASLTMMRTWLLPSLLRNLGSSLHDSMPQKLFELDMAFAMLKGKPLEEYHLAAVDAGPRSNLNGIKAVISEISYLFGINLDVGESDHGSFIKGRSAVLLHEGTIAGIFGELHPEVLQSFGIEEPTSAFEINLNAILGKHSSPSAKKSSKAEE